MISRPRLSRGRLAVGAAALAATLALSSCGTVSPDAARVGSHAISQRDFEDLLDSLATADPSVLNPTGTFTGATARAALTQWITTQVLLDDLTARGVEVTSADRDAAEAEQAANPAWADVDPSVQDFFIESRAVQSVFNRETGLAADELRDAYEQGPLTSGALCIQAILTSDEAVADDAAARLAAGESFGDVAAELSELPSASAGGVISDSSTGLECIDANAVTSTDVALSSILAAAEVGVVSGPEPYAGGYLLVLVRPYDDVADDVALLLSAPVAAEARAALLAAAEPHVASRYGRWDALTASVVALG